MNNYIALTKLLLKNSLTSFTNTKKGTRSGNRIKNIALAVLISVSLLPLAGAIGAFVWTSYPIFKSIGQEGLILGSGLMMISMMVLFFGIFYVMNIFYFSNDTESLLHLPLRPSTIMAAKFTVTLLYEYLTELLLLVPIILAFGIVSKAGAVYYLYSFIGFLTIPVIPLVYAGIINMVLMRFTNLSKNRDQLRIIGGVIAMFAAVFANIKMQSFFSSVSDPEKVKELMLQGNNSLLEAMAGIFPANKLLAIALINSANLKGLINILLYTAIIVLFGTLFLTLGESLYFKGLVGISETKSKRKKLTAEQFEKSVVTSSVVKSYTIKELKLLFRSPVYFINCVLVNFLLPVFMLIPFISQSDEMPGLGEIRAFLGTGAYDGIMLGVAFVGVLFVSGTNGITSTAISREGTNIFVNKYLPVSYLDQILGKVMAGVLLGLTALISLLLVAIVVILPPIHVIVLAIITGILAILFTSFVGILIDLNFPKLHWDNEQKAVKQNINLVVNMLISTVAAAIIAVPTIMFKLNIWVLFGGLLLVFGFVDAILYGLIKSAGVKLFENIEE